MSDKKAIAAPAKKKAAPRKKSLATVQNNTPAPVPTQEEQINAGLMEAISSGQLQPEQLEMVLNAQERILDRQARQAFAADMALCQAEMPAAVKTGWNPQTESRYEKIDDLNNAIKPTYTKYGFAVSFNTGAASMEGWIGMKATVSHRLGWTEEHTFELPIDDKGIAGSVNKTGVHGVASTRSYMRRYLLKEIFNITTTEDRNDDDDGNAAGTVFITEDQAIELSDLVVETKANLPAFLKFCKAPSIEEIRVETYEKAHNMLMKKKQVTS